MGVNARIACSTCEVLTLTERYVLVIRVFVALCQPEIDDVNVVLSAFSSTYQEIVGFDVAVDNAFLMDFLDALDLKV